VQQVRNQMSAEADKYKQQIAGLEQQMAERETQMAELNTRIADLDAQTSTIPALNDQINKLQAVQLEAERLRVLTRNPAVLALEVEETVTGEDGTETVQSYNPILRLVETSSLQGEELEREIQRISALFEDQFMGEPTTEPAQPTRPKSPVVPPAAAPQTEDIEHWRRVIRETTEKINAGDMSSETRALNTEAWHKVRALEAAAAK
jgi:hypothetical protein